MRTDGRARVAEYMVWYMQHNPFTQPRQQQGNPTQAQVASAACAMAYNVYMHTHTNTERPKRGIKLGE